MSDIDTSNIPNPRTNPVAYSVTFTSALLVVLVAAGVSLAPALIAAIPGFVAVVVTGIVAAVKYRAKK